ncbi:hypothetical protein M8494_00985 [Serratia ureilytica]
MPRGNPRRLINRFGERALHFRREAEAAARESDSCSSTFGSRKRSMKRNAGH